MERECRCRGYRVERKQVKRVYGIMKHSMYASTTSKARAQIVKGKENAEKAVIVQQ